MYEQCESISPLEVFDFPRSEQYFNYLKYYLTIFNYKNYYNVSELRLRYFNKNKVGKENPKI